MEWFITLSAALFGLLFGSFANVAIHRWPTGGSVLHPSASHCPACGEAIKPYDNVPVVSWLLLRGRCRHCRVPISGRYPLVEALMGVLWLGTAWVHGAVWLLPALLAFAWVLVVASIIDLEHRIIPNKLTYPAAPALLALLALAAGMTGEWGDLQRAAIAGIAVPGAMLALSETFRLLRGQVGIGMGDIKLAVSIGLVVGYLGGWELVIFAYGSVIAAVLVAGVLLATGRAKLATRIPYGPYLAIGALLAVLAGGPLSTWLAAWLGV